MNKGLIKNEPDKEYRASGFLGSTAIKDYIESPYAFNERYNKNNPLFQHKQSSSMALGTAVHSIVAGEFDDLCVEVPKEFITGSGGLSTSKASKEWQATVGNKTVLTPDDVEKAEFLVSRIKANPIALPLLELEHEVTCREFDPEYGIGLQARFDLFSDDNMIVDIKTTSKPLDKFQWAVRDYRYDVQAAMYSYLYRYVLEREEYPDFYWIVVQTVYPFGVEVIKCSDARFAMAMNDFRFALEGISNNDFEKVQKEIRVI